MLEDESCYFLAFDFDDKKNENKKDIIVHDYVDDNFSMIRNMFLKRKKAYEKVGYEIIENNH